MKINLAKIVGCLLLCVALVACQCQSCRPQRILCPQEVLAQRLQNEGVQILHVGQQSMLVLSTDTFFYRNSTHLNPEYYGTLNDIAMYLRTFDTEVVKVAGYTDNCGNKARQVALSRQQAQIVADFLNRSHTGVPLIYSIGYGRENPIASNATLQGQAKNRRIQITFYRLAPNR